MRLVATFVLLTLATGLAPEAASACERCFGAGSDAPAVAAVSASMFALLIVISGVFVGVIGFFRNVQRRAGELEAVERRSPRNGRHGIPPFPAADGGAPPPTVSPDDPSST